MNYLNKLFHFFIRCYQLFISPVLGGRCRYYPTCSQYSIECFKSFPFHKALWYSILRIFSCHPFSNGGFDPIPCHHGDCNK
ncbi:MAG: membrane protein insertion efficiency factor YidD [Bdellovibrio sp. CG12_big_fil_rev_8_21_14_0_65_39_13]|nr:MAG: membrane protein insertion efficiency factor YidD [Bdellovibrio sp. CG22_combo_CG10-13_8_21_14_all_39_27]PIQ60747.1 MAG: membrane protein insertion efficiency factor YidD [Bdellovibrio sp. CG12_big_fil_rev_8_21_14_0_65_39_13]PIR36371.1 MAG: membrane protein insertion efficiency factor YidD [Bdellovibrio sp. CG11_big_fil_rev_8_21_14_0_20_39_38]